MAYVAAQKWYGDWQSKEHAERFDFRSKLSNGNLVRNYESLNDILLLKERFDSSASHTFLEAGCATAELYRYLRLKYPQMTYYGFDISEPAIQRARDKYPAARVFRIDPQAAPPHCLGTVGLSDGAGIVFAKDVVHHQPRPLDFVSSLLSMTKLALLMRCRTRDVGPTETDPELSCQYHYDGWMPYIVTNLDELITHIHGTCPRSEVVVYRNHIVLGGKQNRFLPKDCFLPETGTAETSVGVFLKTNASGKITIQDRPDQNPSYSLAYYLQLALRRGLRVVRSSSLEN